MNIYMTSGTTGIYGNLKEKYAKKGLIAMHGAR